MIVRDERRPLQCTHRKLAEADAPAASELVHLGFTALAAGDWEPAARAVFLEESSPANLSRGIASCAYAAGAFAGSRMAGLVLMRVPARLSLLFVHPDWTRQGVGRALWEGARAHVESAHPDIHTVECNATPNAMPFYRPLGFAPISAEFRRGGCRATRMACWLPARSLGAMPDLASHDAAPRR